MVQSNGAVISEVKIHFLMIMKILFCTLRIRDTWGAKKMNIYNFLKLKLSFKYLNKINVKIL